MNNLAIAGALATAPSTAFAELRERPRFWFPLLLLVLSTAALIYWYYSVVDFEWLKDFMFGNNADMQKLPETQRAQAMAAIGRGALLWASVIGVIIVLPIIFLLEALYLLLAAKVTKLPQGFKHWFALSCWASLPLLLGNVVAAILLLIRDNDQVSPGVMQALSVNELLVHLPFGSSGQGLLDSLHIPGLLSWILMIIGVHAWSQRSWAFSTILVMLPGVVIFGCWAFLAFK